MSLRIGIPDTVKCVNLEIGTRHEEIKVLCTLSHQLHAAGQGQKLVANAKKVNVGPTDGCTDGPTR